MKTVVVVALLGTLVATSGQAGEFLQTLKDGSWLCDTPESYDLAIAEAAKQNGDLDALKKRLLDEKLCIYVDTDFAARMMVPYATVLERQGSEGHLHRAVPQTARDASPADLPRHLRRVDRCRQPAEQGDPLNPPGDAARS
jgi:hypothetical protein